mgnify:CR=1 FL=1
METRGRVIAVGRDARVWTGFLSRMSDARCVKFA